MIENAPHPLEIEELRQENKLLHRKLIAHHAVHNLPTGHFVGDKCKICAEVVSRLDRGPG